MAKCFITGLDVDMKDAYVLDVGAATRALRSLRQQTAALDRLVEQLSPKDEIEYFDVRRQAMWVRKDRRVVAPTVAQALSAAYQETPIFVPWPEFKARGEKLAAKLRAASSRTGETTAMPTAERVSPQEPDAQQRERAPDDDPA